MQQAEGRLRVHVVPRIEEDARLRTYMRHSTKPWGAWAPARPSADAGPQAAAETGAGADEAQQQRLQPADAVQGVAPASSERSCPEQEPGQQKLPREAPLQHALEPGKPGSGPRQVHLLASSPDWRSEECRQHSGRTLPEPEPGPAAGPT